VTRIIEAMIPFFFVFNRQLHAIYLGYGNIYTVQIPVHCPTPTSIGPQAVREAMIPAA